MKTEIIKIASIGFFNGSLNAKHRRRVSVITFTIFFFIVLIWTRNRIFIHVSNDVIDNIGSLLYYFAGIDVSEIDLWLKKSIILIVLLIMLVVSYYCFWYVLHLKDIIFNSLTKRNIYLIKCETGHLEICISYGIEPPLLAKDKYKNTLKLRNIINFRSINAIFKDDSDPLNFDFVLFFPECVDIIRRSYFVRKKRMYKDYSNLNWNETYITFDCLELRDYLTENQQIEYRELLRFLINQYINDHHSINLFSNEIEFISDNAYSTFEKEVKHLISDENVDYVLRMGRLIDPDDILYTVNEYILHRLLKVYTRSAVRNYLNSRHPLAELSREALLDEFKV
jgi:hypothetical protein